MEIVRIEKVNTRENDNYVAVMGEFDGVHKGHQKLLETINQIKKHSSLSLKTAVITFEPHPDKILNPSSKYELIMSFDDKMAIFNKKGIDKVFVINFNEKLAQKSADDFVNEYLKKLRIVKMVVGPDFSFGKNGIGSIETLKNAEIDVKVVLEKKMESKKIGSFYIKKEIKDGNVKNAFEMLGRPYKITGKVVSGNQVGRKIGFPTANLELIDNYVIPKLGVYVVDVWCDKVKYRGICNIGHNPTVNYRKDVVIEIHILDLSKNLYEKKLEVEFLQYLRGEQKFSSSNELVNQIKYDAELARRY